MKPLNLDNKPCSPISSNCVVWQGPDIPCIKLCIGDTVSDVVFAMATELCTILDTLKVTNYDLTCFNLQACGPQDFQALIQFLITQICELQEVTVAPTKEQTCPDCVVSVADCFVTGTQTTMQLVDYVQLIGERVCSIITEISLINTQITDILIRVTTLENAPVPTFTVPLFTITCASFPLSGIQPIDVILEEFINSVWCGFYAVTGSSTDLTNAINTQEPCITETSETITKPGTTYPSEYPAWVAEPSTVADSITNIWLVLCDLHTALSAGQTITVADTNTIDLELSAGDELTAKIQDTGWVDLEGFDFYDSSFQKPQCRRIGNEINFRGIAFVPLESGGTPAYVEIETSESTAGIDSKTPFQGTGGVTLNSLLTEQTLQFNRGTTVIPTSVLAATDRLDGSYSLPYPTFLRRPITLISSTGKAILHSTPRVFFDQNGILTISSLLDAETPLTTGTNLPGNSSLRYINSLIRDGENVPNFSAAGSDLHSFPTSGVVPVQTDAYSNTYNIPLSLEIDAAKIEDIGGFFFFLDGAKVFTDCSSNIPSTSCY